ncbi:MAG: hypothetical protein JXB13_14825 [Phycisphaerae bacterium]|nr:hypothetical protein [Phycisphaerae bacterium]
MVQYARTHALTYRPLIGGVGITAQGGLGIGTLGLIAYDDSGTWMVSNYHVLCRHDLSAFAEGEGVYQCFFQTGDDPVGRLVAGRASTQLDCAAARVEPGIAAEPWVLEFGAVTAFAAPEVGRRVIKSGLATGITEGIIREVSGDRVRIEPPASFPARYNLSDIGDSGSVWIDVETRSARVLHSLTRDGHTEAAFGYAMPAVMDALRLRLAP